MASTFIPACVGAFAVLFLCGTTAVSATPKAAAQAKMMCGGCHDTASTHVSSHRIDNGAPPPFVMIAADPKMTPEKLRRFLKLPHGNMDNVIVTGAEIDTLISYIQSFRSKAPY